MILITVTEFRNNISKYLQMAFTEKIALKSKGGIIELKPSKSIKVNPSPSEDPWFDNPRNTEMVETAIERLASGASTTTSWEDVKKELGL